MRHLFRQISVLLLCTALFFLTSCGGKEEIKALSYDLSEKPQTIDPQFASGSSAYTIIENAFEGLTRLDDAGEPFGACAERWEVSLDGLTYTFHLREGLVWSDGSPLTAQDFAFARAACSGPHPRPARPILRSSETPMRSSPESSPPPRWECRRRMTALSSYRWRRPIAHFPP